MSQTHAEGEKESLKKHGDVLEAAVSGESHEAAGAEPTKDAVPMPENGGHEKSHAAHLGEAHEHTKPAGNLRQGSHPGALREPPMVVQRVGKQHRD